MKNGLLILCIVSLLAFPVINSAQAPNLGSAAPFTLFTTTGAVSNTGTSAISDKIGTNNGAITGFTPVPNQMENANSITAQASADLQDAYDEMYLTDQTFPTHAAILGNDEILIPGVYLIAEAASIEGNLILDAQGNSAAIFIIKIQGAFSPGPSSKISLINGSIACNVFWIVEGGAIAIATLSEMKGNFIANPGAVSMAATSTLEGRLLSTTGAIAVDGIIANMPMCIPLPVTLLNFKAAKKNSAVELSWTVDDEFSLAGYTMERSAEGAHFYAIGNMIPTPGTFIKTYNWVDRAPFATMNFYRLKITDIDNTFKYSSVLKIDMKTSTTISVNPNPVENHTILLQMQGTAKGQHILSIYNVNGIKVLSTTIMHAGNNSINSIALDKNLQPGIYFLELTGPEHYKEALTIHIK